MPLGSINILLSEFPALLLLFFLVVFAVIFKSYRPKINGWLGETTINFAIKKHLNPNVYHLIPDIMLPTPDGTTQIDHVIVSRFGIFVIETKNYTGWIYGEAHQSQWTQVIYRSKSRFQNPLRQNYKHTKTLSELSGISENYFKSVVVFAGDCTFKTEMPANVVRAENFIEYIRSQQTPIIRNEQVSEIVTTIRAWAGAVTDKQKSRHVENLRQKKAPVQADSEKPACPRCGSQMILRTNKRDGSQFWGCPRFPDCRGIRQAR